MSVNGAATPGEAHPWYSSVGALEQVLTWLEQDKTRLLNMLVPGSLVRTSWYDAAEALPDVVPFHTILLTRQRAVGGAPYVGCPFIYTWQVAVDSHGRQVAERDSRIKYLCYCWDHRWNRS